MRWDFRNQAKRSSKIGFSVEFLAFKEKGLQFLSFSRAFRPLVSLARMFSSNSWCFYLCFPLFHCLITSFQAHSYINFPKTL
jgi:hypothetical protein